MRKILFVVIFAIVSLGAYAQKQEKRVDLKPVTLQSEKDSVSYAFGTNITQGIDMYLIQMGVQADTVEVSSKYLKEIEKEADVAKKGKLETERKHKIDSITQANKVAKQEFIQGFVFTINGGNKNKAYNAGVSVGSQASEMADRFFREAFPEGNTVINKDAFVMGFVNSLNNDKLLLDNADQIMQEKVQQAQANAAKIKEDELKAQYADQIAEGERFMESNKLNSGVVTTPSGLQFKIISAGDGGIPRMGDRVTVNYEGKLLDGTVFDSSIQRGQPATFNVGQLIAGWNEALQLMPVGSKWILYIPYNLAYGAAEQGAIKPYSNLIFELELVNLERN